MAVGYIGKILDVNLSVFDYYTLINWIYTSVVRHPLAGFY